MAINPDFPIKFEIEPGSDLEATIAAAVKANNHVEIGDVYVDRRDNGEIVINQGDWVVLDEAQAIKVAEFILFGKHNTTVTFDVDGVPMTAVVLQKDLERHQLTRLDMLGAS